MPSPSAIVGTYWHAHTYGYMYIYILRTYVGTSDALVDPIDDVYRLLHHTLGRIFHLLIPLSSASFLYVLDDQMMVMM